uniref:Uncharacterized protein n=1 Tax=Rhizophora mucronata TaxID=61149 RepID=A0A2P2M5P4_RHIMU
MATVTCGGIGMWLNESCYIESCVVLRNVLFLFFLFFFFFFFFLSFSMEVLMEETKRMALVGNFGRREEKGNRYLTN